VRSGVALISGITGQDGSYLAELLLEKSFEEPMRIIVEADLELQKRASGRRRSQGASR
jgi:GDP-D-mannose dehydratase